MHYFAIYLHWQLYPSCCVCKAWMFVRIDGCTPIELWCYRGYYSVSIIYYGNAFCVLTCCCVLDLTQCKIIFKAQYACKTWMCVSNDGCSLRRSNHDCTARCYYSVSVIYYGKAFCVLTCCCVLDLTSCEIIFKLKLSVCVRINGFSWRRSNHDDTEVTIAYK